MEMDLGI